MTTTDPLIGIAITPREIYDAVVRLTGRVDVLIAQQEDVKQHLNDHENRIRALERHDTSSLAASVRELEKSRWPIPAVSLLIALGALVISALKYL